MIYRPPGQGARLTAIALLSAVVGGAAFLRVSEKPAAKAVSTKAVPAPAPAPPALTPYQRNHFVFSGVDEGLGALDSPDILLRRAGVEYLSEYLSGYGGTQPYQISGIDRLRHQVALIPTLARAVREMPDHDSQDAARLLVLIGPSARSAIPAVCDALARPSYGKGDWGHYDGGDFVGRANLLSSLVQLCGGADSLAPTLIALLRSPEPQTRRAVAGAFQYCGDALFQHIAPPPQGVYHYYTPQQSREWYAQFGRLAVPALAVSLDDPVTSVRLASARSLEQMTYPFADAPWALTLAPLTRAVTSPDASLRLAALRTLAFMPADVSAVAGSLRTALHGDETERAYALSALCHAAQTDRARTVDAFLSDLASPNLARRRAAAADLQQAATPLWSGDFWPEPYPLPNWYNDNRLFMPVDPPGLTQSEREAAQKRRQAEVETAQPQLLAALVRAAADPDSAVKRDAALSLEKIGRWTDAILGHGGRFREGEQVQPQVTTALTQAASSVMMSDPLLAMHLKLLANRLTQGHMRF